MDCLHTNSLIIQPHNNKNNRKGLTESSGNIQTFALDNEKGIENTITFSNTDFPISQDPLVDYQFPVPKIKLGSNDHHAENLSRLQGRRHHKQTRRQQRIDAIRPYLFHPKYIQYRARHRRDTGEDGKAVWDDRLEDAFQNALINIEPLGRKKKSQRGKPHGRNELISEWILQETGEHRDRKQISSHIQVLNSWLKGIPEWDAVIRADKKRTNETPSHEYFTDSIERMVRHRKAFASNSRYDKDRAAVPSNLNLDLMSNIEDSESDHVARLSFDMWVSLPNQMDEALHNYTRLQSNSSSTQPIPLEDVPNWRSRFPDLKSILESSTGFENCDIILLDASFQLMSDFPPEFSKLGISLELDFLHPSSNVDRLRRLRDWSCVTLMYQDGQQIKGASYNDCHVSDVGKIKPFFESKWWASTFTQLTEREKIAKDPKIDASVKKANETSQDFFRGLTVMQEISAALYNDSSKNHLRSFGPPISKRMAILLWKFSEAETGFVGTTTWQKLLLPPDRIMINSPPPSSSEMALPPLAMDTLLETHDEDLFGNTHFLTENDHQRFLNPTDNLNEDLCQGGFISFEPGDLTNFDQFRNSLDLSLSHHRLPSQDFGFQYDPSQMTFGNLQKVQNPTTIEKSPKLSREDCTARHENNQLADEQEHEIRLPLANFDLSTHKILQAQLGGDELIQAEASIPLTQDITHQNDVQMQLQEDTDPGFNLALGISSAANHFGQNVKHSQTFSPGYSRVLQSFPSSITRPPLQTHHSFAGTGSVEQQTQGNSKHDFENIIANLQAPFTSQDLTTLSNGNGNANDEQRSRPIPEPLSRPQSQPSLFSMPNDFSHQSVALNPYEITNGIVSKFAVDHDWVENK